MKRYLRTLNNKIYGCDDLSLNVWEEVFADTEHPNNYNKFGNSAIIVNTVKGKKLFELIKDDIVFEKSSLIFPAASAAASAANVANVLIAPCKKKSRKRKQKSKAKAKNCFKFFIKFFNILFHIIFIISKRNKNSKIFALC